MAQKRKLEKLQDTVTVQSSPNSVSMEWIDPSVVLSKIKQMDTRFLQSTLARAYSTCPQTRRAIDIEHERIKNTGTAKDALTVGNKSAWNMGDDAPWNLYDSDLAATPIVSPRKLQKLSKPVLSPGSTASCRAETDVPKEGPKYNTPTAIAKRAAKEARQQGLPVYCTKCKKVEPAELPKHWPVPNGGDGVVCLECRSTRWKKPGSDVEPSGPNDQREGSNTTLWAMD